jgi:ribosomal protein L37AE/L43A
MPTHEASCPACSTAGTHHDGSGEWTCPHYKCAVLQFEADPQEFGDD